MTTSDEHAVDPLGICPGCDLPASVGAPCTERACARRGLYSIPLTYGLDLPADRDPMLGRMIDDMLVVSVLGVGGFGRVYRAVAHGHDVAIKLASATARGGPDPIAADRLQREAKALAAIDHPNVVKLLGAGTADGVPYLVLEHVADAQSLEALIARRGHFDAASILMLIGGILDALAAAHLRGIVHRDVKPENVLVLPDLTLRVLDFGLAHTDTQRLMRSEARHDRPRSATVGTPTHMAPEQMTNTDIGPWTDFYGVGVIAFELLTGRLPFAGRTASAVLRERADPRRDVLDDAPALPEAVLDFLAMALAESPRDRFQSAAGMHAALEDALEGWDDFTPETPTREPVRLPASERSTIMDDGFGGDFGLFELGQSEQSSRESSVVTRARAGALTLVQVAPIILAALLTLVALGGRGHSIWSLLQLGFIQPQVALALAPEPAPPEPPPVVVVDPAQALRKDLVERARRCALAPSELEALASACLPELGCRAATVEGDLLRGLTLPDAAAESGTLVLAFAPRTAGRHAPDECATRFRRGRAIVAGAWDQIDAAWGGYVQPRVVLEAKQGRDAQVHHVLVERAPTRESLAGARATMDAGFSVCLDPATLGDLPLRALEELRFQAVDGGRFGEEGRSPCRLDTPRAYVIAPPLGAVEP